MNTRTYTITYGTLKKIGDSLRKKLGMAKEIKVSEIPELINQIPQSSTPFTLNLDLYKTSVVKIENAENKLTVCLKIDSSKKELNSPTISVNELDQTQNNITYKTENGATFAYFKILNPNGIIKIKAHGYGL